VIRQAIAAVALAALWSGAGWAQEAPGLAVGTKAPELKAGKWVTSDGKAPILKGKVVLVDFWFAM